MFADLILEILQEEMIKKLHFRLPFFIRYVDDILTAIPADKVNEIKNVFNKYNQHIQFTIEEEKNQRISFLELLCIRENQSIKTDWYHKDTWSGRYLNFNSHLPMTYKRNTVALLAEKILLLSETEFHAKNFELLRRTLKNNFYPHNLVEDIIRLAMEKVKKRKPLEPRERKPIIAVPYVKGLFEKLKSTCNSEFTLVGKGDKNLRKTVFSRLKDKTPTMQQSNVVYRVICSCGAGYVGQTKQKLCKRIYQHKHAINVNDIDHSALVKHAVEHKHVPKWDEVKIIDREVNLKRRLVLEMIHIRKTQNCMNKQQDSVMLATAYDNII